MAFDPTLKNREEQQLENTVINDISNDQKGMKPHFYMEMLIQIYQSIDFLKNANIPDD